MPEPSPSQCPPHPGANEKPGQSDAAGQEPVWTYRGYRLRPSEFTTAMVHYFRAEVQRANVWRQRLDSTTNWAVITTGASLTIAFSQSTHHGVLVLSTLLVTLFLVIEARRYRYYELWSSRIRLLETDFYAAMLVPPFRPAPEWAESLAETLLHPSFPISMWEALGRRYRRNYMWVYLIMALAWFAKTALVPGGTFSWYDFLQASSIGDIPGEFVILVGAIFNGGLFLVGTLTAGLHQATGEVLPRFGGEIGSSPDGLATAGMSASAAWFRRTRRRRQVVALIVTDKAREIADLVMRNMERGVTELSGTGMYTGSAHSVLLCAITVTEVIHLKEIVRCVDPRSFLVVSPAEEILGRGFRPIAPAGQGGSKNHR